MGADKSQIAVETALSTHPNIVLVSEAYAAGDKTLDDVVSVSRFYCSVFYDILQYTVF